MNRAIIWMAAAALAAGPTLAAECVTATVPYQTATAGGRPGPVEAGSNGRVAVVSVEGTDPWSIGVALFSSSLQRLTTDVPVASDVRPGSVEIAWDGSQWGLFWRSAGDVLHLQRVSAGGELLGGPVLPFGPAAEPGEAYDVEAADGGWVLGRSVSSVGSSGIFVSRINGDGSVVATTTFPGTPTSPPVLDVEPWSEGFAVIWQFETASGSQTFLGVTDASASNGTYRVLALARGEPELEWDVARFIVISRQRAADGSMIVYANSVTPGFEVGPEQVLLTSRLQTIEPLEVEFNGNELGLLYHEVSGPGAPVFLRLLRFTRSGQGFRTLNDTWFAADPVRNIWEAEGGMTWTGASWVAGITRATAEGQSSFLSSICPLGADIVGPGTVGRLVPVVFEVSVRGGQPPYEYDWDFGDSSPLARGEQVTHVFVQEGTYRVTVSVRDTQGTFAVGVKDVHVVTEVPALALTLEPLPGSVMTRESVTLAAIVEGGTPPVSIVWQLGDGRTATGAVVHASWSTPGRYTITVVARDAAGWSARAVSATIEVLPRRVRPVGR